MYLFFNGYTFGSIFYRIKMHLTVFDMGKIVEKVDFRQKYNKTVYFQI